MVSPMVEQMGITKVIRTNYLTITNAQDFA